jgi:hypothetical protein
LGSKFEQLLCRKWTFYLLPRDRKRLLCCLIDEVQLTTEDKHNAVRIVWKSGALTEGEIARILNKQGRRTSFGNPYTQIYVTSLRDRRADLDRAAELYRAVGAVENPEGQTLPRQF